MPPYYGSNHKLYEFVAHGSAVTCLALGQKSGRVMVTGGDDAKINLWAIGKPNCIMSLNGHRTSIECAKFNHNEDIVGAGSASGAIKLWDLEAAKLIQTLTGHKTNVRSLDFHPYGHFLASGSFDTSIKLWDYRKKGCIFTYKVHSKDVHCLKLSPDGRWLASGGNEGSVMLYDIVAGKMLAELKGHSSAVTDVVFHPNEFLLASSSLEGTVKFWDLESFLQVSATTYQSDVGAVRKIAFHPEGKALIAAGKDALKVYGWEPTRVYDSLSVGWGRLNDMSVLDEQLIAGTYSMTNVSVYMVDMNSVQPFSYYNSTKSYSRDNVLRQSTRRSFNFDQTNKTCKQLESLESNRTDDIETNGSDGDDSLAEIYNACDYKEIFQSRRELTRTPPLPDSNLSSNSSPNDYNQLRSLPPETNIPHSYSISSLLSAQQGKGSTRNLTTAGLSPSVRHISESLTNLSLSHRNNNLPSSTSSNSLALSNLVNNNTNSNSLSPVKDYNCNQVAQTNGLMHATSLSELHHTKNSKSVSSTPGTTLPSLVPTTTRHVPSSNSLYSSSHSSNSSSSNYSKPPSSSSSMSSSINGHLPTPNKITSVVRPVISDKPKPMPALVAPTAPNTHAPTLPHPESSIIIPETRDHAAGLDFNDFLPKHIQQFGYDHQPFVSEIETISTIVKGHKAAKAGLDYRRKQVQIVLAMWSTKDSKTALEYAINLDEKSIIIDILNVMIWKPTTWNLDISLILLPCILELLQSKYESYMSVGCSALSMILKTFAPTIKNNISAPPGIGVDISREERYNKCMKCYNHLLSARAFVLKRQTLQGKIGRSFRELSILMQNLE